MVLVHTMTPRYRLVPVVSERNTSEELQKYVSDEPCDDDKADDDADYPKLSLRENAPIEEEYG